MSHSFKLDPAEVYMSNFFHARSYGMLYIQYFKQNSAEVCMANSLKLDPAEGYISNYFDLDLAEGYMSHFFARSFGWL